MYALAAMYPKATTEQKNRGHFDLQQDVGQVNGYGQRGGDMPTS